jgi:hypothetical protein
MINAAVINKWRLGTMALAAGLALSAAPIVHANGVNGGGGHVGDFGSALGGRVGFGGRECFGYGRFGYGGLRFYGFGLLGYGLFFDALPLYYSTYLWEGSPYHYANHNFYRWNALVGQYKTVRPPQNLATEVTTTQAFDNVSPFAYPRNGQTSEQQATDRIECQRWAIGQTGIDSSAAGSTVPLAASPVRWHDYLRAESGWLEARGYSVQ